MFARGFQKFLLVFWSIAAGSRWQRLEGLLDFYILEEILDKVTFTKLVHDSPYSIRKFN